MLYTHQAKLGQKHFQDPTYIKKSVNKVSKQFVKKNRAKHTDTTHCLHQNTLQQVQDQVAGISGQHANRQAGMFAVTR